MGTQHCCFSPLLARPGKHTYGTAKLTRDAAGVESAGNHGTKSQGSLVVRYHSGILNQPAAASRPPGVGSSTLKHPPPPRRLRNNKGNIVTASRVNFNSVCSVLVRYGKESLANVGGNQAKIQEIQLVLRLQPAYDKPVLAFRPEPACIEFHAGLAYRCCPLSPVGCPPLPLGLGDHRFGAVLGVAQLYRVVNGVWPLGYPPSPYPQSFPSGS
ncbi:hypothetical protein CISG_00946 [Coccidioides immitis RMSCC 3703]|uniref:Uncharacterized protein n=2 Tax=Coccidioides immitis TaxID=5501 RepID=A0A0J8TMS8_COCIT|nr:hypothetical protein CIRG_03732 [Coccidioides immitis RMSCC 2394]KMU75017.1 hypothetical protein CISG_00946 [Coccidioides immitis RMSCC 3703]